MFVYTVSIKGIKEMSWIVSIYWIRLKIKKEKIKVLRNLVRQGMGRFVCGSKILISIEQLEEVLGGSKVVFVVCDPFIVESDKISYLTKYFDKLGIKYSVYSNVVPDPGIDLVAKGISELIKAKSDTVIGFGGGSAIDACKAIMYIAEQQGMVSKQKFIAIPTTSGTGSEVTDFSVITDEAKSIKYPLISEEMLPDFAILDAEFTLTIPPAQTAVTGMDALTHAIEAIASKNATDFSDAMAEKAIRLVRSNLIKAYQEPLNYEARQAMHNASCMAGIAFNNAGLGLNHGMAHALGAHFHVPHGKANAVLLPYVMGFNAGCFDKLTDSAKTYARIARIIHVDSSSIRQSSLNLIRAVKNFNNKLDLPKDIKSMGIAESDFKEALDAMAKAAFEDKCTSTNPKECTIEDIKEIFTHAYFGIINKKFS